MTVSRTRTSSNNVFYCLFTTKCVKHDRIGTFLYVVVMYHKFPDTNATLAKLLKAIRLVSGQTVSSLPDFPVTRIMLFTSYLTSILSCPLLHIINKCLTRLMSHQGHQYLTGFSVVKVISSYGTWLRCCHDQVISGHLTSPAPWIRVTRHGSADSSAHHKKRVHK